MNLDNWLVIVGMVLLLGVSLSAVSVALGRFIGLQVGAGRLTLALLVGVALQFVFERQVVWGSQHHSLLLLSLQFGVLVLAAMLFLVISELIVPQGSLPPINQWPRKLRGAWARFRRTGTLLGIADRRGLNPLSARTRAAFRRRPAEQAREVRLALQEAGVTFVKLGQVLSTRPDLLPAPYVQELSQLQQQVAPAPWPAIRLVLETELEGPLEQIFAHFDEQPLAAASIGQVHRAALKNGQRVVVKVQRPGIRPVVERDLDIAERLGQTLETRTDWGRTMGTAALTASFADALREELDFTVEARNMTALERAIATHPPGLRLTVPQHQAELTTPRVLVMQELDGVTLSDAAAVASLTSPQRAHAAQQLFSSILRQITVDGVFHADPHPGNLMLLRDGTLGLIDLGSVGRIDRELQAGLQQIILAVEYAEPQQLTDALIQTLGRPEHLDETRLKRALGRFIVTQLQQGGRANVAMFSDLLQIVTAHGLHVPAELAAAFRAIATLEGTLVLLDPTFDIVAEARRVASAQLQEELAPRNLQKTLEKEVVAALPVLRRLTRHIDQLALAAEEGRLSVHVRLFSHPQDQAVVGEWLRQVLLAFLAAVLGLIALGLLALPGSPRLSDSLTLYQLLAYNLSLVSIIMLLRVLFVMFRHSR